jgi:hypothetical protein
MVGSTAWGTSLGAPKCNPMVTLVPGLKCYLCVWTVPRRQLTRHSRRRATLTLRTRLNSTLGSVTKNGTECTFATFMSGASECRRGTSGSSSMGWHPRTTACGHHLDGRVCAWIGRCKWEPLAVTARSATRWRRTNQAGSCVFVSMRRAASMDFTPSRSSRPVHRGRRYDTSWK